MLYNETHITDDILKDFDRNGGIVTPIFINMLIILLITIITSYKLCKICLTSIDKYIITIFPKINTKIELCDIQDNILHIYTDNTSYIDSINNITLRVSKNTIIYHNNKKIGPHNNDN